MPSSDKKYAVEISVHATEMLVEHVRFLAQVSHSAAMQLHDEFYEAAKSLDEMPERHTWLSDPILPPQKYRKLLFGGRYYLVYLIDEDNNMVYVDYILDCRKDYGWLIK